MGDQAVTPAELDRAAAVWLRPDRAWPSPDDQRVIGAFGPTRGPVVVAELRRLETAFWDTEALHRSHTDLTELTASAKNDFIQRFPQVPASLVKVLANRFSYANR